MEKVNIIRAIMYVFCALATALGIAFGLSSCNVTRVITTQSSYVKHGDTTTTITTKTIEAYDAKKTMPQGY